MTAKLIDTHAHLVYPPLSDTLDLVLARARTCGVATIVTVGTDPENSRATLALAEKHPGLFAILGIHPHAADKFQNVDELKPLLGRPNGKILALGETGLDYHYQFADRPNQQRLFQAHLELARQADLPVVVHCREAFDDCLAILHAAGPGLRGVFHCFSGNDSQARQILDLGWLISFSGTLTFKNAQNLRQTAKYIGPGRLLTETDCPYLSPEPVRKNRTNEPANVIHIAQTLADIFNLPLDQLAELILNNAKKLFLNLP
jgi:TatD DNase family protein